MFIEIDNNLINVNNVTSFTKFNTRFIRIYFVTEEDYMDITEESEEERDKTWEWLRGILMDRQVNKNGK